MTARLMRGWSERVKEFLARPTIAARLASGELLVKEVLIDTSNEHVAAAP